MSSHFRRSIAVGLIVIILLVVAACAAPAAPPSTVAQAPTAPAGRAANTSRLEVFTPWTTGSEAAGLMKLYNIFTLDHPNVEIVNATVAGGAGLNAQAVLTTRLLGGDPPDSFQARLGSGLYPWVKAGYMDNLDDLYKSEGWNQVFPQGVLEILSWDGHYWSVPANVHRANVLWYNKKLFADANLEPPKTMDDFFRVAEAFKARDITSLALGDTNGWESTLLFETVLISRLGPDKYKGLWTGKTDWQGPEVKQALDDFKKMLGYVNQDHASLSWDQASELVLNGKAAMTIMGDWVDADNAANEKADITGWAPAPGNDGVFDVTFDTFGLPNQARDRQNTIDWLKLVGSKQGQEAFNAASGSGCARTDCDQSLSSSYWRSAMQDWTKAIIVPSVAQDSAIDGEWASHLHDIIAVFVKKGDVAAAQISFAKACRDARVCQ